MSAAGVEISGPSWKTVSGCAKEQLPRGFPTCRAPGWLVCTSTPTQIGPDPWPWWWWWALCLGDIWDLWDINILKLFSWRECPCPPHSSSPNFLSDLSHFVQDCLHSAGSRLTSAGTQDAASSRNVCLIKCPQITMSEKNHKTQTDNQIYSTACGSCTGLAAIRHPHSSIDNPRNIPFLSPLSDWAPLHVALANPRGTKKSKRAT